jgi:hypothetical protein
MGNSHSAGCAAIGLRPLGFGWVSAASGPFAWLGEVSVVAMVTSASGR